MFKIFYTFNTKCDFIMKQRIKKKKRNTNKIGGNNTLRNHSGRPWPMTPKAGVTLRRRRYNIGGIYD